MTRPQRTIAGLLTVIAILLGLNLLVQMPVSQAKAQASSGPKIHDLIQTRHLEIVDANGNTRIHLGATEEGEGMVVVDAESRNLAAVVVDRNGTGKVVLRDRWGRESILTPQHSGRGKTVDDDRLPPDDDAANISVYTTRSGTKYHREGCRYLSKSKTATTVKDAKGRGLSPCKVCKPPA